MGLSSVPLSVIYLIYGGFCIPPLGTIFPNKNNVLNLLNARKACCTFVAHKVHIIRISLSYSFQFCTLAAQIALLVV